MFIFQQRGGVYLFAGCVPRIDIDETRIIAPVSRGFRRDECTCVIVGKDSRLSVFPSRTPSSCLSVSVLINHDNPCLWQTPERIRGTNWAKLITRSLGFASQPLAAGFLLARKRCRATRHCSRFRKDGAREKAWRNRSLQRSREWKRHVGRPSSPMYWRGNGGGNKRWVCSRGASNEGAVMQPFKYHPSLRIYGRACFSPR